MDYFKTITISNDDYVLNFCIKDISSCEYKNFNLSIHMQNGKTYDFHSCTEESYQEVRELINKWRKSITEQMDSTVKFSNSIIEQSEEYLDKMFKDKLEDFSNNIDNAFNNYKEKLINMNQSIRTTDDCINKLNNKTENLYEKLNSNAVTLSRIVNKYVDILED